MSKVTLLYGIAIGIIAVTAADWRWIVWSGISCVVGFIGVFVYSFTEYGPGPFWEGSLFTLGFGASTFFGSLAVWFVLGLLGGHGPEVAAALTPFPGFTNGVKQFLSSALRLVLATSE